MVEEAGAGAPVGHKTGMMVPEFTLSELKLTGQNMTMEQVMNLRNHECDGSLRQDCPECAMAQAIGGVGGLSSQGDSESIQNGYGTSNSLYYRS